MHKLVVLYPEPSDPEHFRKYYVDTHLPLVAKLPGILDYRYSFEVAVSGATGPGAGKAPYFAIFEADFEDEAALVAAVSSPEGVEVNADVKNYATGGATVLTYPAQPGRS